jgi:hypothetical protein
VSYVQTPAAQTLAAQTSPAADAGLPKEPAALLAAAAPLYDFTAADVKPWHLKASYQVSDDKGNSEGDGIFEYWWVSPEVNRQTWTRGDSSHSEWQMGEKKYASRNTGKPLRYFEFKLMDALLSPLPGARETDPANYRLEREMVPLGDIKLPCIMVTPIMVHPGQLAQSPMGLFPTYCFDPKLPALRVTYSMGNLIQEFNRIAKVQNRYLPREVEFYQGKQKILSATVDSVSNLDPADPALTAPPDIPLTPVGKVNVAGGMAQGMLLNKVVPVYPQDAKDAHVSGKVVLQALIGTDGAVHDLRVISAPWPSLAASSLWSVSHWQYRPYLLNGQPVEVETTVNVVFSLGQ